MPDPVTAQVIDVPRPRWPELWACLYAHSDATFSLSVWRDREDAEPDSEAVAILRIPASDEPAPTAALRAENERLRAALTDIACTVTKPDWYPKHARAALAQEAAR